MSLNVSRIGIMKPRLLQLIISRKNTIQLVKNRNIGLTKKVPNLNDMASSIKKSIKANNRKTANLTNIKKNAKAIATKLTNNPTPAALAKKIWNRTVGVRSIADADKVITDILRTVKDPSLVKNTQDAWRQWKKDYYKNGNMFNEYILKTGINLIPKTSKGTGNSILETGTMVTQDVLGKNSVKVVSNSANAISNRFKLAKDKVATPYIGMPGLIKADQKGAKDIFSKIWKDIKDTSEPLKNTVVSAGKYIGKTVKYFPQNPISKTVKPAKRIGKGIKTIAKTLREANYKTIGIGLEMVDNVIDQEPKKIDDNIKKGAKKFWYWLFR